MASEAFVSLSLALGLLNLIGIMIVVILPQWRVNSIVDSAPSTQMMRYREGLWLRCTSYQEAYFNCDTYDSSIIGLAVYLNAFRALMIIALLFSVVAVVCSALGMRCASVLEEDSKEKRWVLIVGGILHIMAGALTGICVSWYAAEVVREYYYVNMYPTSQIIRYTLGPCLYVGWICMIISLVCGGLMACCTCFNKPVNDQQAYSYKPTTANEKYSLPPATTTPAYKPVVTSYDRQPDYHRSQSSYHHRSSSKHGRYSHHSSHHGSHHGSQRSDSSYTSHPYRDSPKSSRHEGDITRASGFV